MRQLVSGLILSFAVCGSGVALADKGGTPNDSACSQGNASFCDEGRSGSKDWGGSKDWEGSNSNSKGQVPEMSVAGMPLALGLVVTLLFWRRDRKKSS
jgi:hypothetical protein